MSKQHYQVHDTEGLFKALLVTQSAKRMAVWAVGMVWYKRIYKPYI